MNRKGKGKRGNRKGKVKGEGRGKCERGEEWKGKERKGGRG